MKRFGLNPLYAGMAAMSAENEQLSAWDAAMENPELRAEHEKRVQEAVRAAVERLSAENSALQRRVEELSVRNERYERNDAIVGAGVSGEFVDYVAYEVSRMAGEGDFGKALEKYIAENPQYLRRTCGAWGQQQNGEQPAQRGGVESAFAALNPDLKF